MTTPGSEIGALWGLNYLIATSGLPSEFAATYNQQLAILVPAVVGLVLAIEGALAGGAAGRVSVEPL